VGAPKAYVASMSRVGQRGIVGGKFWLADPNDDTAWRKKDWIVEVVDEDKHYRKGRHTFDVVFFKIVEGVDGEEAFTQSQEDIKNFNVIYVIQWDGTYKKNYEKHLRREATLAKAKEIVAQVDGDSSAEEEEDDADNVPQEGPAMPKKRRREKIKKVTSATFFVPVGDRSSYEKPRRPRPRPRRRAPRAPASSDCASRSRRASPASNVLHNTSKIFFRYVLVCTYSILVTRVS